MERAEMRADKGFRFQPLRLKAVELGGELGKLVGNITQRWLIGIRETNPAILDMIADAGYGPQRPLLAWSGEFAGKYLTCATQIYLLTGDKRLREYLEGFVGELLSLQKPDGYLGVFSKSYELTGKCGPMQYLFDGNSQPETVLTWDSWAHYHMMLGLLFWSEATDDEAAFEAVLRIAELFLRTFYGEGQPRIVDTGSEEMNLSVLHAFALLYQKTGEERYLRFAERVVADLEVPPAGDYLRQALKGVEFYQMPKPRWESLHPIEGLLELYGATGDEKYRQAAERIWWSITETDLHNTGGFSTWEQAVGSPYREGPVETCCVIAYMALSADMLRLTGNSVIADILELATLNTSMGSFSPSGRWSTYDTPMEGYKRANYHQIGFQCRPGSPDLNCCSVNAPRAFGLLNDWAYMEDGGALVVNYYGPHCARLQTKEGTFSIRQETEYPYGGIVRIHIETAPECEAALKLRIPFWSKKSVLFLNGEALPAAAGSYAEIRHAFRQGDVIELRLDMDLRVWAGEERLAGRGSLFFGPLVLCADPFYDRGMDITALPELQAKEIRLEGIRKTPGAGYLFDLKCGDKQVTLCDLYTAGSSGSPYTTWLPMAGLRPVEFSRENPFRLRSLEEA